MPSSAGLHVARVLAGLEQQEVRAALHQRAGLLVVGLPQLVESDAAGDRDGLGGGAHGAGDEARPSRAVENSSAAWRASRAAVAVQLVRAVLQVRIRPARCGCRRRCWSRRCPRRLRSRRGGCRGPRPGRVWFRFSLQPSSVGPPKSAAVRCCCCSMVPMAPSSTRMRVSRSSTERALALLGCSHYFDSNSGRPAAPRANRRRTPSRNTSGYGNQAHYQEGLGLEIVEEARLHQHIVLIEQRQRPLFLRAGAGHLQRGAPAPFNVQDAAGRVGGGGFPKVQQVFPHAGGDLRLYGGARSQQRRRGVLYGRGHREVGIGNPLQALECRARASPGAPPLRSSPVSSGAGRRSSRGRSWRTPGPRQHPPGKRRGAGPARRHNPQRPRRRGWPGCAGGRSPTSRASSSRFR